MITIRRFISPIKPSASSKKF